MDASAETDFYLSLFCHGAVPGAHSDLLYQRLFGRRSASQKKVGLRLFIRRIGPVRSVLSDSFRDDDSIEVFLLPPVAARLEFLLRKVIDVPDRRW